MNKPWLNEYPMEVPRELDLVEKPLQSYLTDAASLYSNKAAILFMGKDMTFKERYESALKFANYLKG